MPQETTPDMHAGLEAATAALAARMSGKSATPPPSEPPPEPPPAEPAPSAPPAGEEPPAPSTPAPAEPGAPEPAPTEPAPLSVTTPAAQRFLEMFGGDPDKAFEAALAYNNRLSALSRAHPELFGPGAPGDPNAPPPEVSELFQEPAVEAPSFDEEYYPEENDIESRVNAWVNENAHTRSLMQAWAVNDHEIQQKRQGEDKLKADIGYIQRKIEDTDFASDDIRKADLRGDLQNLRFELGITQQDRRALEDENRRLDEEFRSIRGQVRQQVVDELTEQAYEENLQQTVQQAEAAEYSKMKREWPAAMNRAIQQYKIPQDQIRYFKADAKSEALATLADPDRAIDNIDAFLVPIAKRTMERIDLSHRTQAAHYGSLAHQRAATPSPTSAPGATPPPTSGPADLESVMEGITDRLTNRMRG